MTRRRRFSLPLLGLLVLAGAPALRAADAPPASPFDERISIELVDASPADALRSFAQLTGVRFDVAPEVVKPFTATLHNVRVRTALDVLCESVGCEWMVVGGTPSSVTVTAPTAEPETRPQLPVAFSQALGQPISLRLDKAAAKDVLASFRQMLAVDLAVAPEIAGEVTIRLEAVPVASALDAVCAQIGCAWMVDVSGSRPVLRVRKVS